MYPQETRETLSVNKVKARTDSQVWLLTSTHAAWHMFMCISIYKPTCVYTHTYIHTFTHDVHTEKKSQNQTEWGGALRSNWAMSTQYSRPVRALVAGMCWSLTGGLGNRNKNFSKFSLCVSWEVICLSTMLWCSKDFLAESGTLLLDLPTYRIIS